MQISKQVKHIVKQGQPHQMIVNGQAIEVPPQSYSSFVCPDCGRTLIELQVEIPFYAMKTALTELQPEFTKIPYCPSCGAKLDYDICDMIDVTPVEIKTEEL